MDGAARLLVVMRHAHAEETAATDSARPLTAEGRAAAAAAGAWLAERGVVPQHALVSAAERTRQTWETVAEAAGWRLEPDLDRGLYAADPETALDLVRLVPDEVRTLVVVGHNPTVATLAQLLDDGDGDVEAGNQLAFGYPPAALTLLRVEGDWADLGPGTASVVGFHVAQAPTG